MKGEPFVFINTYKIKEGKLDELKKNSHELVELVDAKEPRMLCFAFYLNDDRTEVTTLQVHPDADSMMTHMQVAAGHIEEAHEFLDFSSMRIQVYGDLPEPVRAEMQRLSGSGVPVSIKTESWGFNRFPEL